MSTPTADHEEAFEIWANQAGRSDAKTAEITGIPRRTIAHWRLTKGWRERYLRIGAEDADLLARTAVMTMRQGMDLVTERLLDIVGARMPVRKADGTLVRDPETGEVVTTWASKDGDAIKASQLLAQYALGPAQTTPGLDVSIPASFRVGDLPGESVALPEPEDATPEDLGSLRAAAAQMLEETAMSVNTRVEPGRRRGERV